MKISPDQYIMWQDGFLKLNHTIFFTWIIMIFLLVTALILRLMLTNKKDFSKLQNFFEILITGIEDQISQMGKVNIKIIFPIIATLFIFILSANLLQMIPTFHSPTASLSTTIALVIVVITTGISYGIYRVGFFGYLKKYTRPTIIMLPLNLIGDISSNTAMAIRLYGNMMSGMVISAIVTKIAFLVLGFPIFLSVLSFISSVIQAYIFSILALVFMMSAED